MNGTEFGGTAVFAEFARRFAGGGDEPVGRTARTTRDAVARRARSGALFARTSWWEGRTNATGCLLWIGTGEGSATDLDRALRARVTSGGEEGLGLQWSALARVTAGELTDVLAQAGVPETCEVLEYSFGADGDVMTLLFLRSAPDSAVPEPLPPGDESPAGLEHLLDVRLPLTVRLGTTRMSLDDVLSLTTGSIVELEQREDEPLEVLANGRVVARGEVVVVDERFGLRITQIGSRPA